jgi:two-component system, cell cycle sensor histidine kinase PleC
MGRLKRVEQPSDRAAGTEMSRADLLRRLAVLETENALLKAAQRQVDTEHADADAARRIVAQLYDIVEGARQGIVVHRGKQPFYANIGLVNMLGLPSRNVYMRAASALDFVHPDDRPLVADYVDRFLAGAELPSQGEFRLVRADGTVLWVDSITSRIVWDGEPAVLSSMTDITARRKAERALRRSQTLFSTVFQASPDVLTLNNMANGHYVDVNETFLQIVGRDREEVIGRTSVQLGIWVDRGFPWRLKEILRRDGIARDLETAVRAGGGETRDLLISAEVIRVVSHELRTPLNAILGFSEVIRDQLFGAIGEARYAEYASDIHSSGQHLLQIINDLLDLSKLEAGKLELHDEELSLARLVEDCIRLVRGRAENGGLKLRVEVAATLPAVRADARLLKQILINLLSNATKFTPRGGTVTVAARLAANGGVEIDVIDTGIGMSDADIQVALSPFGQVDGTLSRRHEGTGLGLPLARALAELHGGALVVRSKPGSGTTVSIQLPAARSVG